MVLLMNTNPRTSRLVLVQMLLKETQKDVAFYTRRVEADPSEANRKALADAEAMAFFYEEEVQIYS
jgi:hypothetical protein